MTNDILTSNGKKCAEKGACLKGHIQNYDICYAVSNKRFGKFCEYQGNPLAITLNGYPSKKHGYECTFCKKINENKNAQTDLLSREEIDKYLKLSGKQPK